MLVMDTRGKWDRRPGKGEASVGARSFQEAGHTLASRAGKCWKVLAWGGWGEKGEKEGIL